MNIHARIKLDTFHAQCSKTIYGNGSILAAFFAYIIYILFKIVRFNQHPFWFCFRGFKGNFIVH